MAANKKKIRIREIQIMAGLVIMLAVTVSVTLQKTRVNVGAKSAGLAMALAKTSSGQQWFAVGPFGEPAEDWNTAEGLLVKMRKSGIKATEVDEWVNGGWESHFQGLPFNNFEIKAGSGYLVKSENMPMMQLRKWQYDRVNDQVYHLGAGYNLISIPLGVWQGGLNAEKICLSINNQGGQALEVDTWYRGADGQGSWLGHLCGSQDHNFNVANGVGYFVKLEAPGVWELTRP